MKLRQGFRGMFVKVPWQVPVDKDRVLVGIGVGYPDVLRQGRVVLLS